MLSRLARNTAFSAAAYALNGVIGLALVPLIVGAYGVHAFGLIVLSRSLLPAGALGALDLGLSEIATQSVARARGSQDWTTAGGQLAFLGALALGAGLSLALILGVAAPWLASVLGADAQHRESFTGVLLAGAAALVLLFPGLVAEGTVKGFERFGILRSLEVAAALAYALAALACTRLGVAYAGVAYAYLATTAGRYVLLAFIAVGEMRREGLHLRRWSPHSRADALRRSLLMLQSKLLGALQLPVPPLLIGVLVGPAGVGVYDIVTRLPRFLKSTLSLVASAVLPVAARLEGSGAADRLRGMGEKTFWLVPYVTSPILFGMAGLAKPILEVWVGPQIAGYWPWLVGMLIFPVLNVALTMSQAMLQVRPEYLAGANRISTAGIAVQFTVSLTLVSLLGAMSFVLGIAAAAVAIFPFHLRLIARTLGTPALSLWRALGLHWLFGAALGLTLFGVSHALIPPRALPLAATYAVAAGAYWAASYALILGENARHLVGRLVHSLVRGPGA